MEFLLVLACVAVVVLLIQRLKVAKETRKLTSAIQLRNDKIAQLQAELEAVRTELQLRLKLLARYQRVMDAEAAAGKILEEANQALEEAKRDAQLMRQESTQKAQALIERAEGRLATALSEAENIVKLAQKNAEDIAGDAYAAMGRVKELTDAAQAMKNIVNGYGDSYIVPTYNLLDDLAEEFGFTDAGKQLQSARETSRSMIRIGAAAECDYAENNRKQTAVRFVIDAFNGKVDSILSRSKTDNHGKLEQEIRDAYALVNHNGTAFRNARITDKYLSARLEELKWATAVRLLREQEREEQRRLREQLREEEKARREYERAIKEAAKEEETLRKAMQKVQQQVAAANDAQRAAFEAKLLELQDKLFAAEQKNQRALSMAQQTRTGHVYIISNIGSFGEKVLKIGMTRRLEPLDRIKELGDASVPFEFDVHAMIYSEDAPGLEKTLHRHFLRQQINKVNPRKEFFKLGVEDIRTELEQLGVETQWTIKAMAREYRETLRIEQEIIENPALEQEWSRHQLEVEAVFETAEEQA